jgi:hypothetical protein
MKSSSSDMVAVLYGVGEVSYVVLLFKSGWSFDDMFGERV